jgi:predicted ATPase
MIKRFQVQNYKALRDVTLDLTPIHVLIGPNDTGKTSILEALAALCRSVDHHLHDAFTGTWEGHQLVWHGRGDLSIKLTATIESLLQTHSRTFSYSMACSFLPEGRHAKIENESIDFLQRSEFEGKGLNRSHVHRVVIEGCGAPEKVKELTALVFDSLRGVETFRWDARFLALPVAPDAKRRFRMEPSGFGLALFLDDILGFDRDLFIRLEQRFREVFPHVKSIKLIPEPAFKSPVDDPDQIPMLHKSDGKGIYFEFENGGELVPARQVSDGVLLVLAYLAVLHLPEPPRLLLVEEPENGIHPKRLKEVVSILRSLIADQSQTQVLLTTHSPYVVDLFKPEEVTLCKKEPDGSVSVRRLSESKSVQEQLDVFTLGEIWTAEGDEALAQPGVPQGEPRG